MIDLERLLRVPCVDSEIGFDISPDGSKVAFSWDRSGQWEIYEMPLDGTGDLKSVSGGPGSKFAPKYSPDGTRLAYAVDFDGGENFHIFVHDFASGKQTDLTPSVSYAIQPNFAWSPDGKEIAYLSDRTGCFCAYAMPVLSGAETPVSRGESRLVLDVGHPTWNVHWSPDGSRLAVTAEWYKQDHGIFIVVACGGKTIRIAGADGPINAKHACWSPDGSRLVFCSDVHGYYDIGIYDPGTDKIAWVTEGEGDKTNPAWSPDGTRLAYVHGRGAVTWLVVQKPGEAPLTYQVAPGVHSLPKFTPDGKHVVFAFDNPRHPVDLWLLSLDEGTLRQLTFSMPPELAEAAFVMPEEIWYPSLDGQNVPALLFRPKNASVPGVAVVIIHGGPTWLFAMLWYPVMAHMASRGWAVLAPNYRGSTGYGKAWQQANYLDLGGVDTRDVAAGAMYLVRAGLADPKRIGVTGKSHGGYLTMTCLTQYPDLWEVGSAVVPFLNWFKSHEESRRDLQHWNIENFGDPKENHDRWYARSPYFFLDRLRAPVQLICSGNDPRCPAGDVIEARDRLQELGKEFDFAIYPDEGHALHKIENVVSAEQRRIDFLAKVLEE